MKYLPQCTVGSSEECASSPAPTAASTATAFFLSLSNLSTGWPFSPAPTLCVRISIKTQFLNINVQWGSDIFARLRAPENSQTMESPPATWLTHTGTSSSLALIRFPGVDNNALGRFLARSCTIGFLGHLSLFSRHAELQRLGARSMRNVCSG